MDSFNIVEAFNNYKSVIFEIDRDIRFWKSFLNSAIKNYQSQDFNQEVINSMQFTVYDIDLNSNSRRLTVPVHEEPLEITKENLENHRKMFFSWILNLSTLRGYVSLETFLLQAIWLKYFPNLSNPTKSKKDAIKLQNEIKSYLNKCNLKFDKTNNLHLMEFLKKKSPNFSLFTENPVLKGSKTTWGDYFRFISILRNIIAHQSRIVTNDALDAIKSKAKDIFDLHFSIYTVSFGFKILKPKEEIFLHFISLMNDFTLNAVKLIFDENDFGFLGLPKLKI